MSKKKYKKIWLEDEEGNIEFGGIKEDSEHIKLVKELNDEVLRKIKHKNQTDYWFKEFGGYIHMSYTRNQLLFNELNISRPNISRIIYLATYIEYNYKEENLLVRKRANINNTKHLNKKDLKKLLKLSPNAFREFIKEMKELNLLYEVEDKFYLTDEYFSKGKCRFKDGTYTRLYINTTKSLYENCTVRQHRQLSYVYQLIPFMHFKNNVICKNPYEEDMCNVEKMNLKEICKLLGVNPANSARLEKDLLKFNITLQDHKYYLFSMVMVKTLDGMRDFFVVNPSVIWKGTDVEDVVDIIDCMFFK